MKYTIKNFQTFQKHFPDEATCLDFIFENKTKKSCASCKRGSLYRVTNRKCYACSVCGSQIHPLAGTIFEKSSTPLSIWFYTIYIITRSKKIPSAKKLEQHLGVTYKTAWRIMHKIKPLVKKRSVQDSASKNFLHLLQYICKLR